MTHKPSKRIIEIYDMYHNINDTTEIGKTSDMFSSIMQYLDENYQTKELNNEPK